MSDGKKLIEEMKWTGEDQGTLIASIAISLKRIADILDYFKQQAEKWEDKK